MRLRVEVEWQGTPWRLRGTVRLISFVDTIFGLMLSSLYIYKLCFPEQEPSLSRMNTKESLNVKLVLVFLIAANLIQCGQATFLFIILRKGSTGVPKAYLKAKSWFDFTEFVFLFSTVKCIATVGYLVSVGVNPWVLALAIVTVPETGFKAWGMFHVYRFLRDLRHSMKYYPKIRFIPIVSENPRNVIFPPFGNNDKDNLLSPLGQWDVNANSSEVTTADVV